MNKYDIAKEFYAGFLAALMPLGCDDTKPAHWQAGYLAGYRIRAERSRVLNEYLASIGQEPMGIIKAI